MNLLRPSLDIFQVLLTIGVIVTVLFARPGSHFARDDQMFEKVVYVRPREALSRPSRGTRPRMALLVLPCYASHNGRLQRMSLAALL